MAGHLSPGPRERKFHVLVNWPNGEQPWLVLIPADSPEDAQAIVEGSDEVVAGGGTVVSVTEVTHQRTRD